MKFIRSLSGLLALLILGWALLGYGVSAGTVATAPATQQAVDLSEGFKKALDGNFRQAVVVFENALKSSPENHQALIAVDLLSDHVARCDKIKAQRTKEYEQAVARVRQSLLAERSVSKLSDSGIDKKLRKTTSAILKAYGNMGLLERLENADGVFKKTPAEFRRKTTEALDNISKTLDEIPEILTGHSCQYSATLNGLADKLKLRLLSLRQALSETNPAPADIDKLKALNKELARAIADIDSMTSKKPWRFALLQGRLAKELSGEGNSCEHQAWFKLLLAELEHQAVRAVAQAQWKDAFAAYSALEDLLKNTGSKKVQFYTDKVKAARRHVRVLRLYGPDKKKSPTTKQSSTAPAVETGPTWKEIVRGVDAKMAVLAVKKLNDFCVTSVDYKKLARGSMMSLLVLARTPQAKVSFPLLAEKSKLEKFTKVIEDQIKAIETSKNPDQLDLILAFNNVLSASEDTVKIPTEVLAMEFTDGLLDELDRFSSMIWPHDVTDFNKQTMGQFFGVGIQITKKPGKPLKVVTPLPGTPAFRAGIKVGDTILAVDGRATDDLSIDKLVRMITGQKGTKVVLTITRTGLLKPMDVAIIRREIHIRTVKGWRRTQNGQWDYWIDPDAKIGYMRLSQFTDTTSRDVADVLKKMKKAGMDSLVLDLRFNPGGLLRSASRVSNEFLSGGRIVSTKGRRVRAGVMKANASGRFLKGNLVVLVNEHSASAAEIVSGALKDHCRGLLVGRRTYGKGSVQNIIPIRRKRAFLKLTTAYYYLPSGKLIHRKNGSSDWGVVPDVTISTTPKQTGRWLEIRRKTDLLRKVDEKLLTENLTKQFNADIQLNSAVLLLKLMKLKRQ